VPERRRRAPREEPGYRESAQKIEPDVQRCDELSQAAVARIERDAESCEIVIDGPLMDGHGPMRVSQASTYADFPEIQIFFTIHVPEADMCSLWFMRKAPTP